VKIVSLLPSATELVYALGLEDDLSGVTFECDHPAEAGRKPVVSTTALPTDHPLEPGEIDGLVNEHMDRREPLYRLDRDLIGAIQPDVILTQDLCRVCAIPSGQVEEALDDLGCRATVVSMDPQGLDEVLQSFLDVGRATGAESRASELVGDLRDRIEAVRGRAARLTRPRTLALEWPDPPFVGGHWIPEMVAIAGGEDVLGEPGASSRTVTWTEIVDAAPEVAVYMPCGFGLVEAQQQAGPILEELTGTPAAAGGAVFATDASSFFSRPGPRIVDGLEILAWALHPESFPEPPPGRVARIPGP
jgi:iron complex transport system substrate-binding protein